MTKDEHAPRSTHHAPVYIPYRAKKDPRELKILDPASGSGHFLLYCFDLLANRIPCEAGIGLIVAIYSALKKHSALPALLVLGDLSIQGNLKAVRSLVEPLQIGMDNGARRALIPIENKRHFLDVPADIMERVDPIFFGDPFTAAMKALGMN